MHDLKLKPQQDVTVVDITGIELNQELEDADKTQDAPVGGVANLPVGGVANLPAGGVADLPTGAVAALPIGGLATVKMHLEYDGWWKLNEFHSCPKNKKDKKDLRYMQNKITFGDGDTYEGEVQNGRKHGKGRLTQTNGAWYEGNWTNNKKSGIGREGIYVLVDKATGKRELKTQRAVYVAGERNDTMSKCCVIM